MYRFLPRSDLAARPVHDGPGAGNGGAPSGQRRKGGMQQLQRWSFILALLLVGGGCVEDDVVYQDLPNFIAPPAAAANFLGYYDQATDKTNCGNCHVTQQAKWEETAHSGAWETLQASGHAAATCEGCHTVGNKGNAVTDVNVAYNSTKDTRYHDVQCESCH